MTNSDNYFNKIDFLSENLSFENNGSKIFRSSFGALLSSAVIITTVTISIIFGKEIFEKKLPITASYSSFTENSEFNLKSYPIFFLLNDVNGKLYNNWNEYFNINANFANISNGIPSIQRNKYQAKKCSLEYFSHLQNNTSLWNELQTYDMSYLICLNFDENSIIKNDYGQFNSSFININFNYRDPQYNETVQIDYLKKKDDFYVKIFFINNYINPFDYDNPVKFYFDTYSQQISSGFLRRSFFQFTRNQFISDNGWLFENKIINEYVSFSQINNQIDSKSILLPQSYYWITVSSPKVFKITYRSYMKIQELAAKIGGIINALTVAAYLVFGNYLRFSYNLSIGKAIVDGEIHLNSKFENSFMKNLSKENISNNNNENNSNVGNNKNFDVSNVSRFKLRDKKENYTIKDIKKLKLKEFANNVQKNNEDVDNNYEADHIKVLLFNLENYINTTNYLHYLYQQTKSIFSCCLVDSNYLSLNRFMNYHLNFFTNIKRLAIVSGIIDENKSMMI